MPSCLSLDKLPMSLELDWTDENGLVLIMPFEPTLSRGQTRSKLGEEKPKMAAGEEKKGK